MTPRTLVKTVTAAGTAEPLSATTLLVTRFTVQAQHGNTNNIFLGASDVDSTTENGLCLDASVSFNFDPDRLGFPSKYTDLANWYIDADTNGEGVVVLYFVD